MLDKTTLIREARRTLGSDNEADIPVARLFLLREGLLATREVWDIIAQCFGYKPVQGRDTDARLLIAKLLQSSGPPGDMGKVGAWLSYNNGLYQVLEAHPLTVRVSPMLAEYDDDAWREIDPLRVRPIAQGLKHFEMLWADFTDRFKLVDEADPMTQPTILPRSFSALLRQNSAATPSDCDPDSSL